MSLLRATGATPVPARPIVYRVRTSRIRRRAMSNWMGTNVRRSPILDALMSTRAVDVRNANAEITVGVPESTYAWVRLGAALVLSAIGGGGGGAGGAGPPA